MKDQKKRKAQRSCIRQMQDRERSDERKARKRKQRERKATRTALERAGADRVFTSIHGVCPESINICFTSKYGANHPALHHIDLLPVVALVRRYQPIMAGRIQRFRHMLLDLVNISDRLICAEYIPALWRLTYISPWLRPVAEWKPKGRAREAHFRSLANHLVAKYPVAPFLYATLHEDDNMAQLFAWVAQGGSIIKAVKTGLILTPMTKRMCHTFGNTRGHGGITEAIRRAQVDAFGGSSLLADAVCGSRLRDLQPDEAFWQPIIQWFCNQGMFDNTQVGPIIDFIQLQKDEKDDWSIKGRTLTSIMRGMHKWHDELANTVRAKGTIFPESGFDSGRWVRKAAQGHTSTHQIITIDEIIRSKELSAEGKALNHCVYSYLRGITAGRCSIWSLGVQPAQMVGGYGEARPIYQPIGDRDRRVTLEVVNYTRCIVQTRGNYNRRMSASEQAIVVKWASNNNLTLRRNT